MLQSIRKRSKSWVGIILAGLMVLLFGIWGVEDFVRSGFNRAETVIKVGNVEISGVSFEQTYRREINNLQQRFNRVIDFETSKRLGVLDQIIAKVVREAMYRQEQARYNLVVADKVVNDDIVKVPAFKGIGGSFDQQTFLRYLQQVNLSPAAFYDQQKSAFAREFLLSAVGTVEWVPSWYAADIFKYREESRIAEVVTIPTATVQGLKEPTDAEIEAYYKKNEKKYIAPAYRKVDAIIIQPDDVYSRIKVTGAEIKAAYEKDKAKYTTPEKRELHQIVFRDEKTAKEAYAALVGGRTFEVVAKEFAKREPINLGLLEKAKVPVKELTDAAFKLNKGQVTEPIKSPLGYHLVRVVDIAPEEVKSLESVQEEIVEGIRARRAVPLLAQLRNQVDDAIGGGLPLKTIAANLKLPLVTLTLDRTGKDEAGKAIAALPKDGDFATKAFQVQKGADGEIFDLKSQGFFVMTLVDAIPSKVRPLASIKDRVRRDWEVEAREAKAKADAEALFQKAKDGGDLAALAKEAGYRIRETRPLARGKFDLTNANQEALQNRIFSVPKGGLVVAKVPGGWSVARVKDVIVVDPATKKKDVEKLVKEIKEAISGEILSGYSAALQQRYKVEIKRDAIESLFTRRRTS